MAGKREKQQTKRKPSKRAQRRLDKIDAEIRRQTQHNEGMDVFMSLPLGSNARYGNRLNQVIPILKNMRSRPHLVTDADLVTLSSKSKGFMASLEQLQEQRAEALELHAKYARNRRKIAEDEQIVKALQQKAKARESTIKYSVDAQDRLAPGHNAQNPEPVRGVLQEYSDPGLPSASWYRGIGDADDLWGEEMNPGAVWFRKRADEDKYRIKQENQFDRTDAVVEEAVKYFYKPGLARELFPKGSQFGVSDQDVRTALKRYDAYDPADPHGPTPGQYSLPPAPWVTETPAATFDWTAPKTAAPKSTFSLPKLDVTPYREPAKIDWPSFGSSSSTTMFPRTTQPMQRSTSLPSLYSTPGSLQLPPTSKPFSMSDYGF